MRIAAIGIFSVFLLSLLILNGCSNDTSTPNPVTYSRVDRMGMPAIGTAVITRKDAYNADDPAGDAAGNWVAEITANLTALHDALDDDLANLGLTPSSVDESVAQAAPLVVPDVISIDTSMPSGFPNGRRLTDPVIDVTLAVVLLDINGLGASNGPHTPTDLVGVNPMANDLAFDANFPYLAAPHTP